MEHLSSIIEVLNERFGTDLTDVDKLLLDQFEEGWVADSELADQVQNNTLDNFRTSRITTSGRSSSRPGGSCPRRPCAVPLVIRG
jgi:hypothetical protein